MGKPTLGATGLGWEVQCNGMEISQFTYFQQIGGIDVNPVCLEITYGLERIATFVQNVDSVYKIKVNDSGITYGDLYLENEKQMSFFNLSLLQRTICTIHLNTMRKVQKP